MVLIIFAITTYLFLVRAIGKRTDEALAQMSRNFIASIESEKSDDENHDGNRAIAEAAQEFRFRDYQFFVYDTNGRLITSSNPASSFPQFQNTNNYITLNVEGEESRVFNTSFEFEKDKYKLVVIHPLRDETIIGQRIKNIFLITIPLAVFLTSLGGYFLARKSLAPVVDMSIQAKNISAENLHERLPVKNERDELGNLAGVFNDLLARLDASFEQQRRFMADASHELRTPVAIMRGETEVVLSKEERTEQEYRESLAIVHDESKRLTRIVEDLFTLTRADAEQYKLNRKEFYLDELVGECLRAVRTLATKRELSLSLSANEEMPFYGNEQLIRRLLFNLLDNAIKFTSRGGNIRVACEKTKDEYQIIVADTGVGIPTEEQAHIFERFYRIDKARSHSSLDKELTIASGAGLGLSIARWIAEIHGGSLELKHSDDKGSSFVFVLPRNFHN